MLGTKHKAEHGDDDPACTCDSNNKEGTIFQRRVYLLKLPLGFQLFEINQIWWHGQAEHSAKQTASVLATVCSKSSYQRQNQCNA